MEEGGREGVRFGRRTIVPSILLLLQTTTHVCYWYYFGTAPSLGYSILLDYCSSYFLLLWLIHYRLNYCLFDTAPSSKFSHPPSPDYSITLFSPPSPAAVQSYICQKESYTRDRILRKKSFDLLFTQFVGALQSVQRLMRLWHFCVSFITGIKLKPSAIRLYWTFQMFISPKSKMSEWKV